MELSPDEMQRVAYLQQRLNSLRIQLEKLEHYLEDDSVDPTNAKMRMDSLATLYQSALKYKDELTALQPDNASLDIFIDVESRYFDGASAVTQLRRMEPLMSSTPNTSSIMITERQDLPRLPKIKIHTFDGKRENWASYKNKFIAIIDSRNDISDAVKCSQLFDSLTGQALAKVGQFDPSDKDYHKAWKTLLDFYDHKRIVAVEHLHAILDLSECTKASSDELSNLLDKARQHLHILEGLGVMPGEPLMVQIIERCLPQAIRSRWQDRLDMDELSRLENLFKFIQSVIFKQQALEHSVTPNRNTNPRKRAGESLFQSSNKMTKVSSHTFVTSPSSESSFSNRTLMSCPSCKEAHHLFKCPVFNGLNFQDRWNLVRKVKACQNCLWVHQFPCKSNKRCKKYNKSHHTLLHNQKGSLPNPKDPPSTSTSNQA